MIPRPRSSGQYLVAPLRPDGVRPHHFSDVDEPNGISVPDDPVCAAAQVTRRVLPRYVEALATVYDKARRQPEPPHRPAAPEVSESVTLVWYPDGVVGAPYDSVPAAARPVLYQYRFQYSPDEAAVVLPASYGPGKRALLLGGALRQLTAQGIGVNLRHAAPTLPSSRMTAPALGAPPAPKQPPTARR
ncbi:hypothetical protein [Streptomyces sp. EAS-AB2608]|uniref:hypothetical protein n=1 Tax=Streptomyces sp. EAS-AB2608 TaxID=2779671 RepID=UPI001C85A38A|nr:hypothetical protein [Streptomyces sp. EAS-AB2608]